MKFVVALKKLYFKFGAFLVLTKNNLKYNFKNKIKEEFLLL